MIIRIVKLTFIQEEVENFINAYNLNKDKIIAFSGCLHLELLNDVNNKQIFFTYSKWEDNEALERYRSSVFFQELWSKVSRIFSDKPLAWTTTII